MSFGRAVRAFLVLILIGTSVPAYAQQTGAISGKVVDSGGGVLPGVTVEARSNVLPTPRVATTDSAGAYRLQALPPGTYTLTFVLSGMQNVTRQAEVQLGQDTPLDATLGLQGVTESVEVTATVSLIERDSATIKSSVSNDQIMALPVGQEYRDLIKLIPGVQYTQDQTRGPSAGGSGQDNVYQFDGVNVTLPLFSTLSAEPASHDIESVTTIRGAARAVDFDRSGGFSIDSVSKSGANRYAGEISWQFQDSGMSADLKTGTLSRYEQDRKWFVGNIGGPIIPNKVHFYASYYRPENSRENRANLYGELPPYQRTRNEGFGKVTVTPSSSVLLNGSYRQSKRRDESDLFASNASATTGTGSETKQKIAIGEGSWVISPKSLLTFKATHFALESLGLPDFTSTATPTNALGTQLPLSSLDTQGLVTVPAPISGQTAYNAYIQPLIDRYGYNDPVTGARTGGGTVGFGTQFNDQDFFRDAGQIGYNLTLNGRISHDIHVGYQYYVDSERLVRSSNGWGSITVPGGRLNFNGTPIFYTARYQQQPTGGAPTIKSYYNSQTIEFNDAIRWGNVTFNAGVLFSRDDLYGQGLREDESVLSGYVLAPQNKYKMYTIPFSKMIQPRLGATWAYNGNDTIYGSYARYTPAASSLPRAASWDRNLTGTFIDAHFDANGALFGSAPVGSSSGKLFVDDMTPRRTDEFLLGTAKLLGRSFTGRAYYRYRESTHFWEDTNNTARLAQAQGGFNPPPGIPRELYIPDLAAKLAQITNGSTYVIAELDGAYTKYQEVTLESEYRNRKVFVRGSYTWSHYYGNFDQDNSTVGNDDNIFIGSSNIADGAGRQLWDFKDGDLRGDRPHLFKLYGYYSLDWNATVGAYAFAQSGQPWEVWSYEPYIALTTNTSDTNRYAEPAGTKRSSSHWQLDLNYTQNVPIGERLRLQIGADLFNVFDRQTGYNINPNFHSSTFGIARNFYDPRRFQLAARLKF